MYNIEKMTPKELEGIAADILEYSHWLRWVKIGYKLFGDKLYKIELESDGNYNDEGQTLYYVQSIRGFDNNDDEIEIPHEFYVKENDGVDYIDSDLNSGDLEYDLLRNWLDNEFDEDISLDSNWTLCVNQPPEVIIFKKYIESLSCKTGVEKYEL